MITNHHMEEQKQLSKDTLYLWIAPHLCHLGVSTFVDFLNLLVVPPV
jgi:hypothetical protein